MRGSVKKQSDNKKLRKLNKVELLTIMKKQEEENERLRQQIEMLTKQLDERNIKLSEAGSLSEAAIKLSGVMESAQKAADIYLNGIKQMYYEQQRIYIEQQYNISKLCQEDDAFLHKESGAI